MTSIETAASQVSESEISATLVSLRQRFEAVRRGTAKRTLSIRLVMPHRKGATGANGHVKERERKQSGCVCSRDGAQNLQSPRGV